MQKRSRNEKYPDTEVFHFYNANPRGRYTGDCVVRAICTALEKPYEDVVRELTEMGLKQGYLLDDTALYTKYLKKHGWVRKKQPRYDDNTKYTGEQFCMAVQSCIKKDANSNLKRIIAHIGTHHIVAISEGKIQDIWDPSQGCIGNYFVKDSTK